MLSFLCVVGAGALASFTVSFLIIYQGHFMVFKEYLNSSLLVFADLLFNISPCNSDLNVNSRTPQHHC